MASAPVLEFSDDNFEAEVLGASLPTLVAFWARWSAPSLALAPIVERLALTHAGKLRVGRLDIEPNQHTLHAHGIRSVPTLLLFAGGTLVESIVGAHPYEQIEAAIAAHLRSP